MASMLRRICILSLFLGWFSSEYAFASSKKGEKFPPIPEWTKTVKINLEPVVTPSPVDAFLKKCRADPGCRSVLNQKGVRAAQKWWSENK
jgi:hypothetical protein